MKNISIMPRNSRGFTLVEFMIASVLGLVVIAAVGGLYSYNQRLNNVAMTRVGVQQELRTAGQFIARDARMAGSFGCISLGRKYSPESEDALFEPTTGGSNNDMPDGVAAPDFISYDSSAKSSKGHYGVRVVSQSDFNADLPTASGFKAETEVLLFYYGAGSKALGVGKTFPNDADVNYVVQNAWGNGWYLVAADCDYLKFIKAVPGDPSYDATVASGLLSDVGGEGYANLNQTVLMAYRVVAYTIGKVGSGESALFRLDYVGGTEKWSPPQLLARNVSDMKSYFTFIPDCPESVAASDVNDYAIEVKEALNNNFVLATKGDEKDKPQPPILLNVEFTYSYPDAGIDATGDGADHKFYVSANIRGGNYCANRRLEEQES